MRRKVIEGHNKGVLKLGFTVKIWNHSKYSHAICVQNKARSKILKTQLQGPLKPEIFNTIATNRKKFAAWIIIKRLCLNEDLSQDGFIFIKTS